MGLCVCVCMYIKECTFACASAHAQWCTHHFWVHICVSLCVHDCEYLWFSKARWLGEFPRDSKPCLRHRQNSKDSRQQWLPEGFLTGAPFPSLSCRCHCPHFKEGAWLPSDAEQLSPCPLALAGGLGCPPTVLYCRVPSSCLGPLGRIARS